MANHRFNMETPTDTLDEYEDETTIPRRKKRRSAGRRVSFADTKTVHIFPRDEEYATPPGGPQESATKRREAVLFEGDGDTVSSLEKNAFVFASSEAGDEAAAPVDINHIDQSNHGSPVDDDITLDSTTFSAKFFKMVNGEEEVCKGDDNFTFQSVNDPRTGEVAAEEQDENRRPRGWESDMSFTVQNPRRPMPVPRPSTPASFDKSMTMQYTEMVDAGTLAERRRRVYKKSPYVSGNENMSPHAFEETIVPKKLKLDRSAEKGSRRPLEEINIVHDLYNAATPVKFAEESCCSRDIETPLGTPRTREPMDFLLDTDGHSEVSGRTTPLPTLGALLDRDTCTMDTTCVVPLVARHDTPAPAPAPAPAYSADLDFRHELEKRRQDHVEWVQSKLASEKDKSCRLESQKQALLMKAKETRLSLEKLQTLSDRSLRLNVKIPEQSSLDRMGDDEGATEDVSVLQKESQQCQERLRRMNTTLEQLENRIEELSSVPESYKLEQNKSQIYQKLQGWHITRALSKGDFYRLDISYEYRVTQSITIEGRGAHASCLIQLQPDVQFIEKGFSHMSSRLLFQTLLPAEKIKINHLKGLPIAMQQTSDLVVTLLEVAKEAGECRVNYRCLQSVVFLNNTEHGICLQFCFESYKMHLKVALLFRLQVLSSGEYPKDIVPCNVTVESKRTPCMISEMDISKAISSIPAGYRRFGRICECIDTFLL